MSSSCTSGRTRVLLTGLVLIALVALGVQAAVAAPTPTYRISKIVSTAKPHEADVEQRPNLWVASNELDGQGGLSVFDGGSNKLVGSASVENPASIPVIGLDGSVWGNAPAGAEEHFRHPHGVDINEKTPRAYLVVEHSGLQWNTDRSGFDVARRTDSESGLLVEVDVSKPASPTVVRSWLLGHAAEEVAVNENNGKVYVGNHEPSTSIRKASPTFVSVIDPAAPQPYTFIDLPEGDDVQGVAIHEGLNRVFGTTHVGQKMYAFDSATDTVAYTTDIRGPFEAFYGPLPEDYVVHTHDLTVDTRTQRVYLTIHSLAPMPVVKGKEAPDSEEESTVEEDEIRGHWLAEVDTARGNAVTIIETPGVHAHFVASDSTRGSVLVTGEHTGNLGVVNTKSRQQVQVVQITPPAPAAEPGEDLPEPEVHGVNVNEGTGTTYVSDESDWNQVVAVLTP